MSEKYAYVFERTDRDDYEHVCIDEGTAALYTELDSMFDVSIIFWDSEQDE